VEKSGEGDWSKAEGEKRRGVFGGRLIDRWVGERILGLVGMSA